MGEKERQDAIDAGATGPDDVAATLDPPPLHRRATAGVDTAAGRAAGELDRPVAMAASKAARGAFILFEGVDRCGKTTQSTLLVETLKRAGVRAELWRYPDRTTGMGVMINSYLQSKTEMDDGAIHLLFAANRWEKKKAMEAALAEGITLVVDRYSYSGVAFTAAKKIPGLDLEWCKSPERGLVRPDAVLYLNMPIDAARRRGGFGWSVGGGGGAAGMPLSIACCPRRPSFTCFRVLTPESANSTTL